MLRDSLKIVATFVASAGVCLAQPVWAGVVPKPVPKPIRVQVVAAVDTPVEVLEISDLEKVTADRPTQGDGVGERIEEEAISGAVRKGEPNPQDYGPSIRLTKSDTVSGAGGSGPIPVTITENITGAILSDVTTNVQVSVGN